jgi:hypothetical protein
MDILFAICEKITQGKYEFSKHAVDQSIIRDINATIKHFRLTGVFRASKVFG